jgi:hypothetical protein
LEAVKDQLPGLSLYAHFDNSFPEPQETKPVYTAKIITRPKHFSGTESKDVSLDQIYHKLNTSRFLVWGLSTENVKDANDQPAIMYDFGYFERTPTLGIVVSSSDDL